MNLKESFRYQKFLTGLLTNAFSSLTNPSHCLITTKVHMRNKANPEAEDITETVEVDEFVPNNTIMNFMAHIVEEREKLSIAIGKAKAGLDFDLDAAVETNKSRQYVNDAVRRMLCHTPSKRKTQGMGYKFDVNGTQVPYRYDVEVTTTENYDKDAAKTMVRSMIAKADEVSAAVDAAMINTRLDYEPPYDVNESFDDVLEYFIQNHQAEAV